MDSILRREIEELRRAPLAQIRARYREAFDEEPRSKHREHFSRRLAWRLQAASEGGLSDAALQRALRSRTKPMCGRCRRAAFCRQRRRASR